MKGLSPVQLVSVLFSVCLLIVLQSSSPMAHAVWDPLSLRDGEALQKKIDGMSLDEKVGQMFMVGFHNGDRPAYQANDQVKSLIRDGHVGGIILFDRNLDSPAQVGKLTGELQRLALHSSGIPLLISVDQEGGKILRIHKGVTVFPGNMALGAARDDRLAYEAGRITAVELRSMGINMNLAPVLDVNNNPDNPVIGVRSFSEDPVLVSDLATAQMRGYQDGKVLTAVKHFPGHGDTGIDSHIDMPTVSHSLSRLNRVELVPFRRALSRGADAVMSAHITFPAIEPKPGLPGTLSKHVLTGLLRNRMGFEGVIITDDMEMGAIAERFGSAEAAVRAVQAGADIILVSHDWKIQREAMEAVKRAVMEGKIPEERIDQSLRRILRLKTEQAEFLFPPRMRGDAAKSGAATPDHRRVAQRIAEKAVTLVRDDNRHLPLNPEERRRVLVISPIRAEVLGDALRSRGFQPTVRSIEMKPGGDEILDLAREAAEADAVVVGTFQSRLHREQGDLVGALEAAGKPVVVLGLDTPYDLLAFPRAGTYLALYGSQPVSLEAAVRAIAGEIPFSGKLPVSIPGVYPFGHGLERAAKER